MSINKQSRNAETRDLRNMDRETDNIYLTAVVISRRADQIAEKQKEQTFIWNFQKEWNANIENTSSVGHNFMSD